MPDQVTTEKVKEEKRYVKCKIIPCSCKHPYQDKLHGHGMRVHNPGTLGKFRCTVCGNVK